MSTRATILYVEDNPDNRTLVRRVLQMEGYQVVEAKDAAQAMERLQSEPIDLALMDINMPDIDGYTLTAQIKAMPQFTNIPIVAVTANVMRGDRERSMQAGCDGYIQKPIDIDTLAEQVERFLPRSGARPATAISNTTPTQFAQPVAAHPGLLDTNTPAPQVRRKRVPRATPKATTTDAPQPATDSATPGPEGSTHG